MSTHAYLDNGGRLGLQEWRQETIQPAIGPHATPFIDHWVMQLRGVPPQHINDSDRLLSKLNALVDELTLTRVSDHCHYFEPGVSAVIILSESHLAVHTWPELGYMHVDIVTCVEKLTRDSLQAAFQEAFEAEFVETVQLKYD